ncbi:hypothetical protein CBR_g18971 [Chara braunii]|uniref:Uncharacterized protein n=1 Tax=Chara braunii TaxID=69332 RepID=A0A388KWV9_CHABU|nr:hypothetical protein CBR_g18971 [Chara braunii]|eukprot:GBG74560.1 hypothetical protein CBR_g18971 [Chara braunii]
MMDLDLGSKPCLKLDDKLKTLFDDFGDISANFKINGGKQDTKGAMFSLDLDDALGPDLPKLGQSKTSAGGRLPVGKLPGTTASMDMESFDMPGDLEVVKKGASAAKLNKSLAEGDDCSFDQFDFKSSKHKGDMMQLDISPTPNIKLRANLGNDGDDDIFNFEDCNMDRFDDFDLKFGMTADLSQGARANTKVSPASSERNTGVSNNLDEDVINLTFGERSKSVSPSPVQGESGVCSKDEHHNLRGKESTSSNHDQACSNQQGMQKPPLSSSAAFHEERCPSPENKVGGENDETPGIEEAIDCGNDTDRFRSESQCDGRTDPGRSSDNLSHRTVASASRDRDGQDDTLPLAMQRPTRSGATIEEAESSLRAILPNTGNARQSTATEVGAPSDLQSGPSDRRLPVSAEAKDLGRSSRTSSLEGQQSEGGAADGKNLLCMPSANRNPVANAGNSDYGSAQHRSREDEASAGGEERDRNCEELEEHLDGDGSLVQERVGRGLSGEQGSPSCNKDAGGPVVEDAHGKNVADGSAAAAGDSCPAGGALGYSMGVQNNLGLHGEVPRDESYPHAQRLAATDKLTSVYWKHPVDHDNRATVARTEVGVLRAPGESKLPGKISVAENTTLLKTIPSLRYGGSAGLSSMQSKSANCNKTTTSGGIMPTQRTFPKVSSPVSKKMPPQMPLRASLVQRAGVPQSQGVGEGSRPPKVMPVVKLAGQTPAESGLHRKPQTSGVSASGGSHAFTVPQSNPETASRQKSQPAQDGCSRGSSCMMATGRTKRLEVLSSQLAGGLGNPTQQGSGMQDHNRSRTVSSSSAIQIPHPTGSAQRLVQPGRLNSVNPKPKEHSAPERKDESPAPDGSRIACPSHAVKATQMHAPSQGVRAEHSSKPPAIVSSLLSSKGSERAPTSTLTHQKSLLRKPSPAIPIPTSSSGLRRPADAADGVSIKPSTSQRLLGQNMQGMTRGIAPPQARSPQLAGRRLTSTDGSTLLTKGTGSLMRQSSALPGQAQGLKLVGNASGLPKGQELKIDTTCPTNLHTSSQQLSRKGNSTLASPRTTNVIGAKDRAGNSGSVAAAIPSSHQDGNPGIETLSPSMVGQRKGAHHGGRPAMETASLGALKGQRSTEVRSPAAASVANTAGTLMTASYEPKEPTTVRPISRPACDNTVAGRTAVNHDILIAEATVMKTVSLGAAQAPVCASPRSRLQQPTTGLPDALDSFGEACPSKKAKQTPGTLNSLSVMPADHYGGSKEGPSRLRPTEGPSEAGQAKMRRTEEDPRQPGAVPSAPEDGNGHVRRAPPSLSPQPFAEPSTFRDKLHDMTDTLPTSLSWAGARTLGERSHSLPGTSSSAAQSSMSPCTPSARQKSVISDECMDNARRSQACAKDLEHIYKSMKRKHNEVKDLVVRALVNNATLQMLDKPMDEAKIQNVFRFIQHAALGEDRDGGTVCLESEE